MEKGLSGLEAKSKLDKYGLNEIKDVSKLSPLKILFRQIKGNFVIYLLLFSAIISFFVEEAATGYVIVVVIVVVITAGFVQEYRAEMAINSLKNMITQVSIVIRDGKEIEIPANQLVPGDIILLRNGDKVPADCILVEQTELRVNESVLTGESSEVEKRVYISGEQKNENLIFMGTFIVNGKAVAKVVDTGMRTKFGKIAGLISKEEKQLPLQDKVNRISMYTAVAGIITSIIAGIILIVRAGTLDTQGVVEILIVVIAMSVSAFPEGFPVTLLTTLSSGTYRMAKKNAIVNRMSIIETLGETTVICSDKTGTLTKGEMTVKEILADGRLFKVSGVGYKGDGSFTSQNKEVDVKKEKTLSEMIRASVLCNDSRIERTGKDKEYRIFGSPTEAALLIMAAKAGIYQDDLKFIRKQEKPFNSERKLMSVVYKIDKDYSFSKGAPEILIEKCKFIQRDNGVFKMTEQEKKKIMDANSVMTARALRTLAVAYKKDSKDFENDLIFLGIVAMEDPPRESVKESVSLCRDAGINVKMITGDNKQTAVAIGKEIGIVGPVMEGFELEKIDDEKLKLIVMDITIFARVKPEHKLRIVNALKANGEIVTMTGDGVNDAPALKAAHIGVAMGISGTDVSRDVADLTLKDDNFSTIVSAVGEGRTIFNNMRKFVTYELSCNVAEITMLIVALAVGLPLPLIALQILFLNLVTSDFPAITLGLNPHSEDIMSSRPKRNPRLLTKELLSMLLIAGVVMGFGSLGIFYLVLMSGQSVEAARTTALVSLVFFEIANAFNFRSFRKGVIGRSLFVNKYLLFASALSILATIGIIYTPIGSYFETVHITLKDWGVGIALSLVVIAVFDLIKIVNKRKHFWKEYI